MLNSFQILIKNSLLLVSLLTLISCGGNSSSEQPVTPDTIAPNITSHSSFSIEEGKTEVGTINATDDSSITFTISGGNDASKFQMHPSTGALSFNTTPDFDNPTDSDLNNQYLIEVTATDSSDNSSKQDITVIVTRVDNTNPVFTSSDSASIAEGQTNVMTLEVSDESIIAFSISGGDDASKFQIDSNTGALSFFVAPQFSSPSDSDSNNTYIVRITATDSSNNASTQTLTITILEPDNTNPVFISENNVSMAEGNIEVTTVEATDNADISYAIIGGADESKFEINTTTGVLTFKDAPDFETPTDSDSNNSYIVEIRASDTSNNESTQVITVTITDILLTLTDEYSVVSLGKGFNSTEVVNLGTTPKTLYALFTNSNGISSASPVIKHKSIQDIATQSPRLKVITSDLENTSNIIHAPSRIGSFSQRSKALLNTTSMLAKNSKIIVKREKVSSGDTETFTTDIDFTGVATQTTQATARKVVSDIDTEFGPKTLNIWVSDDSYGDGCSKVIEGNPYCVTDVLVDELADKFLKSGSNNDIYDWVTNIYGEEWGPTQYNQLIEENNEIDILLTDIDSGNGDFENPTGGVVGFFYSKDNFLKSEVPGSNERIMFYVDSVVYANTSAAFKFQKVIYATLAHEFTHMIEYYQKDILEGISSDLWLSEMTAEATEYLTSNHVQHDSPRGIRFNVGDDGTSLLTPPEKLTTDRFPDFNKYNNTFSLTSFNNTVEEYSKVSAFGAFLMNNYGGPELLHDIVHGTEVDENAVVSAANKFKGTSNITFADLLREWGVAVLLSDKTNLDIETPRYNTGDFTNTTFNGVDYNIGSINFFNYITGFDAQTTNDFGPTISTILGEVQPHGNFFYKVGDELTGSVEIEFEADSDTEITLIAK